jgi:glycosyltransferase involved in cell wall biosynthesis
MRICHILETAGGGSGQVVIDLLKSGIAANDDLTVIYSPLRAERSFIAALEELRWSLRIYPLAMRRKVGLQDALAAWRLMRLIRRTGPYDIIHSHSSKAGALARIAGILIPHARQVYTPHAFVTMAPDARSIYGAIERMLSWLCHAIICVSEQERRHALWLKIAPRRLHVVPNGIALEYPADRTQARAAMGFDEQDKVVGFVGRLAPQKNPARLVEAFAMASQHHPRLKLAVVGDGVLRADTERLLAAKGLSDRARLICGAKGRDLMPGFDCLACSSDYEAFSIVFLEALAIGVPIVATPVGGVHEAIIPGKTGFIASDFSVHSLASAIAALTALDGPAHKVMSDAARTHAENFSTERMGQRTRAVYAALGTNAT